MQDPQVIQILQIVAPTAISVVFIISGAAVLYNWIDKRAKRMGSGDPAAQARVEEKLNHLSTAVDAIAVEVERISEGQRFTTKLLADNAPISSEAGHEALASEMGK